MWQINSNLGLDNKALRAVSAIFFDSNFET